MTHPQFDPDRPVHRFTGNFDENGIITGTDSPSRPHPDNTSSTARPDADPIPACPDCLGEGFTVEGCDDCNGEGEYQEDCDCSDPATCTTCYGEATFTEQCFACDGDGSVEETCETCDGTGLQEPES